VPENVFENIKNKILPQWKTCFFVALLVGFMAHFYKLTNWLPNWDSLVFRYDAQQMIGLGRWFLPVVCAPGSFYDLPFLNGFFAILLHALGAVCICKVLNAEKKVTSFLIGALTASFPAFTSVMMYSYVADGYGVAFLLSCLAAVFMTSHKPRYVYAFICIVLSTGIYQAYITVTAMLVVFHLIDELSHSESDLKQIIQKGFKILFCAFFALVAYYAILKILLIVFKQNLLDYQGLNDTAAMSNINIRDSLYCIKETFLNYFFDFSKGLTPFVLINIVIFVLTVYFYILYFIKNGVYKSPLKLAVVFAFCCIALMCSGALAFINASVDYHNLMLMGYLVYYLFFVVLYERGKGHKEENSKIQCWAVLILSLVLTFTQVIIANVSYHKAQLAYEKSYGTLIRIADRIEQTENSEECKKIVVVGALENSEAYSAVLPPDITGITDGYILRADDETVGQSVLCSALNDYCGKDYTFLAGKEKKAFTDKTAVKNMNCWPQKGCVAVIDNVIVIKLGSE